MSSRIYWQELRIKHLPFAYISVTMRITCDAEVVNRLLPAFNMRGKNKPVRCQLSVGKKPGAAADDSTYLMMCTKNDRNGAKYMVRNRAKCMVSTQKCSEVYAEKWSCVRVRDGAKNMVRNGAIYVERCDYSVCETTSAHQLLLTLVTEWPMSTQFFLYKNVLHIS